MEVLFHYRTQNWQPQKSTLIETLTGFGDNNKAGNLIGNSIISLIVHFDTNINTRSLIL